MAQGQTPVTPKDGLTTRQRRNRPLVVVHGGVGKVSFDEGALVGNVRAFVQAVNRAKPSGAKGTYVKKVSISSTMGPGVSLDLTSATQA